MYSGIEGWQEYASKQKEKAELLHTIVTKLKSTVRDQKHEIKELETMTEERQDREVQEQEDFLTSFKYSAVIMEHGMLSIIWFCTIYNLHKIEL